MSIRLSRKVKINEHSLNDFQRLVHLLSQGCQHGCTFHWAAVIRVQKQLLALSFLPLTYIGYQISRILATFFIIDLPTDNFTPEYTSHGFLFGFIHHEVHEEHEEHEVLSS